MNAEVSEGEHACAKNNIKNQLSSHLLFNFTQARLTFRLIIHFSVLEDFSLKDKLVINA